MKIGFIGIGNMGWPMATNILKAGHDVIVLDVDAARSAEFARTQEPSRAQAQNEA